MKLHKKFESNLPNQNEKSLENEVENLLFFILIASWCVMKSQIPPNPPHGKKCIAANHGFECTSFLKPVDERERESM